mmetsp:Transcript_7406/g.12793  ORF Transcript_7406/g.12793 Transcript_7406/m.12793 type:complete len:350 (+) Transcript_7406:176-1225(+)|eukprot:CAMPEP_0198206282 /NCGR_PEP_ID=MMETSP1445-20131203/9818_1 /TAXON_ID=36898 /ORGANISM="Pyramimonas sp., Strain CCMP2087" /LENGTH=349 /DNA_ID=CAMNT_0043878919 /DNA_START=154 /DNA_END=1203 /DNA_ORIENTATION=+
MGSNQDECEIEQGTLNLASLLLVFNLLDKRIDLPNCALVCREWHRACSQRSLWHSLNLAGAPNAGHCLDCLMIQPRCAKLAEINLEFAQGIDDSLLESLAGSELTSLTSLNLNACQQVSDKGISALLEGTSGPLLQRIQIYWNLQITDETLSTIGRRCAQLTDLNLSGCKKITTDGLISLAHGVPNLLKLDITSCPKVRDAGVSAVILGNPQLRSLILYANSQLTDDSFVSLELLPDLRAVDLCGMQRMTDKGLQSLAGCTNLTSLNLTWCVNMTDEGILPVAAACPHLRMLSVHGVRTVTDALIETLANTCKDTLTTIDVKGCMNIKRRSLEEVLVLLPNITCFSVHS